MELPSSRFSSQQPLRSPSSKDGSTMSTLNMRAPTGVLPSARDMFEERNISNMPSRPRSQNERIELPSIRLAIPELSEIRSAPEAARKEASTYSPTRVGGASDSASYISSPSMMSKRRRISTDDDASEAREYSVPRVYRSPRQAIRVNQPSYSPSARRQSQYSLNEVSTRVSPYSAPRGLPGIRPSASYEQLQSRAEFRPNLPSLPALSMERAVPNQTQRPRVWSDYALDTARVGAQSYTHASTSPYDQSAPHSAHSPYSTSSFSYGYQPRAGSFSGPVGLHHPSMERSPFTGSGYHHGGYDPHTYELGVSEGSKQRKRRGNLPKETTDKLRAWFVAHLQHPYPTEDEKQDLMRQTGLQMNQISNWFINARRRQLPAMINNARAESDARSAQGGAGGDRSNQTGLLLGAEDNSGSEGGYDEDYEGLSATRSTGPAAAPQPEQGPMSVNALTKEEKS